LKYASPAGVRLPFASNIELNVAACWVVRPEGRGVVLSSVQPACAALASLAKCRSSLFFLLSAASAAILAILALSASALSAAILAALSASFSEDDIDFVEICYKWY
jgi:hypothetical protein